MSQIVLKTDIPDGFAECHVLNQPYTVSLYSYSLWAGRPGDRTLVVARLSAPVQTGPRAQPASYTMITGSFPGIKRPGRGVEHPPQSSAEVQGRVELYFYSPSGPSWPVIGWTLPLSLSLHTTLLLSVDPRPHVSAVTTSHYQAFHKLWCRNHYTIGIYHFFFYDRLWKFWWWLTVRTEICSSE